MKICKWKTCNNPVKETQNFCSRICANKTGVDKRRKLLKQKAVDLLGGKCSKCGYNKCFGALHFHHLENKSFGLSAKGLTRSWKNVIEELKKCILVCANCHAEIHALENL